MTDDEAITFYHSADWLRVRAAVLKHDHYECQLCKEHGKYTRATTVHHVKHLKDRPDLALSLYDGSERQLVSLCSDCHNIVHPEKALNRAKEKNILTKERW